MAFGRNCLSAKYDKKLFGFILEFTQLSFLCVPECPVCLGGCMPQTFKIENRNHNPPKLFNSVECLFFYSYRKNIYLPSI